MTLLEFTGGAMIAFGPALAMFVRTISNHPIRVILMIASSFFWLLSFLTASIVWFFIPHPHIFVGVAIAVTFQELFRCFMYVLVRKSEAGLRKVTVDEAAVLDQPHLLAYVVGFGYGVISGTFSIVNILAEVKGPGTMGLQNANQMFSFISAITTMLFIYLNTFWSVILFQGLDGKNYYLVGYVFATHLLASATTLFNAFEWYGLSVSLLLLLTIVTAVFAFKIAGGSFRSFVTIFKISP